MDEITEKKGSEVVNDKEDDVGSSVHVLPSPHFASVAFYVCLFSKGACWRVSTLLS